MRPARKSGNTAHSANVVTDLGNPPSTSMSPNASYPSELSIRLLLADVTKDPTDLEGCKRVVACATQPQSLTTSPTRVGALRLQIFHGSTSKGSLCQIRKCANKEHARSE